MKTQECTHERSTFRPYFVRIAANEQFRQRHMTDSRKPRRRLVADRRYSASKPKAANAKPSKKQTPPLKKTAKPSGAKSPANSGAKSRASSGGKTGARKPNVQTRKSSRKKATRRNHKARNPIVTALLWPFRMVFKLIFYTTAYGSAVAAMILGLLVLIQYSQLPESYALLDGRTEGSITLLDRHGDILARQGNQFGGAITTETVSKDLVNAVVASEDKRFWWHLGVSPRGVASAVRINLSEGRSALQGHGGSTISQQTAKLLCLGREFDPAEWKSEAAYVSDCRRTTLTRKIEEAIYAFAMEAKYSKDEILSIYLNRAYMGGGAYGASAAADVYFGKDASQLNAAESAMIAGLLTAPSSLAPTANLKRSQNRAATVLRLMNEQGYLSDKDTAYYQTHPATLTRRSSTPEGGYFADWVIRSLAKGNDLAEDDARNDLNADILRALEEAERDQVVQTTLDPKLQKAAADAVTTIFEEKVSPGSKAQVAVVVMSADGAVRAMVGGRDVNASNVFNRAIQAVRQPGSSFKPFVYATALELGYSPYDTVLDERYCINVPGSGNYCPSNYDHKYHGRVTLVDALKNSFNIPAVKVSEGVGRGLVHQVASDFGIISKLTDSPSLALGASESTLLEMTGAYAGILNGGSAVTPYGIVGEEGSGIGERVIQEKAAKSLIWMMEKVVSEGTGKRAALPDRQVAGKTGTSQEARDAWFIGFSADYVAGVWMGYDDNTPLKGVTGSGLPAEIWHETMLRVHEGLPSKPLPMTAPPAKTSNRVSAQSSGATQPTKPAPTNKSDRPLRDAGQNVLQQILRDLLGGGN